jgi:cytochrome c55X
MNAAPQMLLPVAPSLLTALLLLFASGTQATGPDTGSQLARGWAALRAMDCARCHGRDYDGWAAPSLIASVRGTPRERFERSVLDGDIGRGMPGYAGQPLVVADLDAIYAYLLARARGEIGAGKPRGDAAPAPMTAPRLR